MEWRLATDRTGVRTECYGDLNGTSVFTHHSIEYDGSGDLREISSVIVPGAAPLILRRTPGAD